MRRVEERQGGQTYRYFSLMRGKGFVAIIKIRKLNVRRDIGWWWYEGKRVMASDTEVTVTSAVATETAGAYWISHAWTAQVYR